MASIDQSFRLFQKLLLAITVLLIRHRDTTTVANNGLVCDRPSYVIPQNASVLGRRNENVTGFCQSDTASLSDVRVETVCFATQSDRCRVLLQISWSLQANDSQNQPEAIRLKLLQSKPVFGYYVDILCDTQDADYSGKFSSLSSSSEEEEEEEEQKQQQDLELEENGEQEDTQNFSFRLLVDNFDCCNSRQPMEQYVVVLSTPELDKCTESKAIIRLNHHTKWPTTTPQEYPSAHSLFYNTPPTLQPVVSSSGTGLRKVTVITLVLVPLGFIIISSVIIYFLCRKFGRKHPIEVKFYSEDLNSSNKDLIPHQCPECTQNSLSIVPPESYNSSDEETSVVWVTPPDGDSEASDCEKTDSGCYTFHSMEAPEFTIQRNYEQDSF